MDISVVILSAGAGTRMKSTVPKVLHKLSGKEMIYYIIKESKKVTDNVDLVLYHNADLIEKFVLKEFSNIGFHRQDMQNFPGTGGAIKNMNFKADRVFVLNGDTPLIEESSLRAFLEIDADIVVGVMNLKNPFGYGRVIIENQNIKKIVEQKDASENEKMCQSVNSGVYLFKKDILDRYIPQLNNQNSQNEYYLTDIIELAVRDNLVIAPVFVDECSFKGVNSKLELAEADEIMQKRIKDKFMVAGVLIKSPNTVYIDSSVTIDGESCIENGVTLLGESSIINSHIKTNSIIESSKIEDSQVGPMARIRPQSEIKNSTIGNFVEIKKSKLNGVKAGHLAYIGDAIIEDGTNIGAGVITCNYDGKSKYTTKIGKNVFVGSDVQLIAPIELEDDTIIAAGTSVNRDVPKGSLAINREPLTIIKDYYYKFFGKKG
jgi:bifunctional UDP-N-acetylglucosamine pyrophosphorylase/glucosamine-1-phosphate N-acetyltransferase